MMDLYADIPADELLALVQGSKKKIAQGRRRTLAKMGKRLKKLQEESFEKRSRGGAAEGITWKPLDEIYRERRIKEGKGDTIGVIDGTLKRSLKTKTRQAKFLIAEYSTPYARLFNASRPLLPEDLPDEWLDEFEEMAQEWGDRALEDFV